MLYQHSSVMSPDIMAGCCDAIMTSYDVVTSCCDVIWHHYNYNQKTLKGYMLYQHSSATVLSPVIMTSCCEVTWRRDVILWCHMTSWHHHIYTKTLEGVTLTRKTWKSLFNLMTPTFDLSPYELVQDFIKVNSYTKFCVRMSNNLAARVLMNWQTETRKHGSDSTTSITDSGDKDISWYLCNISRENVVQMYLFLVLMYPRTNNLKLQNIIIRFALSDVWLVRSL